MSYPFYLLRSRKRLWFTIIAVFANLALAAWFWLSSAKTTPPPEEPRQAEEPILFKKNVQVALVKEALEQSIENLPDFNDTVPSMACLGNSALNNCPAMYGYAIRYYPSLNRVRKILEEGRDNPGRAVPILKRRLAHAMDDYKRIVIEDRNDSHSRDPIVNTRWNEFEKRRIYLSASVYLLVQFGTYDALPLMAKFFIEEEEIPKLFADESKAVIGDILCNCVIVNRLFLFYAMHHLVRNHPREKLPPRRRQRLDEYLEASKAIPAFEEVSVPSWRATYEAWDYRITILRKDMGMNNQPHIRVFQFPTQVPYLEDFGAKPQPQVSNWFAQMKLFIDEAYPTAAKPASATKEASK